MILEYFDEGDEGIVDDNGSLSEIMEAGRSVEAGFTEDDADPEQLSMGIKIEMEHTTNPAISKKIALDHLAEIPDYYTRLVAMEKDAGINMEEKLGI